MKSAPLENAETVAQANWRTHWNKARAQSLGLVRWLWRFFNAPGPNDGDGQTLTGDAGDAVAATAAANATGSATADWLREMLLPFRPAYRQAIMLAFLINVIGLGAAVFTLQIYDRVVAHGAYSSLTALVVGMLIAIGMEYALRGGRSLLLQRLGARVEVQVAERVFTRLVQLPALVLENRPPAYWQTVFRDIELVRATVAGTTALLLIDLPFLLLSLVLIAIIAPPILPVALLVIVAFVVLAWRSGQVTRSGAEAEREKLVGRDASIAELASVRMLLKSSGASESARTRWETHYASWMQEALVRSRESDYYRDVAHGMTTANVVVTSGFGALAILNQLMTMGALISANILAGRMVSPLVQLVGQWRSFGQFQAAKKRLDDLFALAIDASQGAIQLPRPRGVLRMENLVFRYPGSEHDQLQGLNGQLGPHGLHAIVGANGSGKSTLLRVLRGLYPPTTGRVLLDEGDMAQFGQSDLSRWIAYLPQQVQLVSGSIRDNIALGAPQVDDATLIQSAQRAGAHDFILNLPEGYGTQVGEGGQRFSGGERKRIAIAQVLLRDPPILLLDEPSADLDSAAEQAFVATLRTLAQDHTVLVVTHSPALLARCNGVLVLDRGRLAAAGPAAQILPKLGLRAAPDAATEAAHD